MSCRYNFRQIKVFGSRKVSRDSTALHTICMGVLPILALNLVFSLADIDHTCELTTLKRSAKKNRENIIVYLVIQEI